MSKLKTSFLLVCMTFGFINVVRGQIYESEACFYASAGSNSVSQIVCFEGSRDIVWVKTCGFSRQKLAESKNYYENEEWHDGQNCVHKYEYDRYMSTSQRVVYKRVEKVAIYSAQCANMSLCSACCPGTAWTSTRSCGRHGYKDGDTYYVAFSRDKSSFIYWRVSSTDVDKEPRNKKTYTRIPKEDLLPKAANYDFLNE